MMVTKLSNQNTDVETNFSLNKDVYDHKLISKTRIFL